VLTFPAVASQRVDLTADVRFMNIQFRTANKAVRSTLIENATARDFAALLPLVLVLEEYAQAELISDLPKKLTTEGSPSGSTPSAGDIAYYAPWGNLAIFYKDQPFAKGLIVLGSIDSDVGALIASVGARVTIELVPHDATESRRR
jgi:hypothetical protein